MSDEASTVAASVAIRPYPAEHACRLRDPGGFQPDSFRRMDRKHEGKTYSVIIGRPKGQTATREQALRYPRSSWTEAQARAHCTSHGGNNFEAATGEASMTDDSMMIRESCELPMLCREARFSPTTADADHRTVEICWTTGAVVRRRGFFSGDWDEELSLKDGAVLLDRLNNGASLLDSHNAGSLDSVIGVVERAWFAGSGSKREGRAVVRFSERETVEPIWRDVQAGILRNISVGYRTHRVTKIERENGIPLMRADLWEPLELSLVAVPADAQAQVRNGDDHFFPCIVERQLTMDEVTQAEGQVTSGVTEPEHQQQRERDQDRKADGTNRRKVNGNGAEPEPGADGGEEHEDAGGALVTRSPQPNQPTLNYVSEHEVQRRIDEAIRLEAERCTLIREQCAALKLEPEIGEDMIQGRVPADTAWRTLLAEQRKREHAKSIVERRTTPQVAPGEYDERAMRRRSMVSALLHRADPNRWKLEFDAQRYVGFPLLEMSRHWIECDGIRTIGMDKMDLAGYAVRASGAGYLTSSDFANVLLDAINKSLRAAYDEAPRTYLPFCRRTTIADFKNTNRIQLGEMPSLLLVTEHGEYKRVPMSDAKESYALQTYGAVFPITRKVIINDDLEAFTRLPQMFGTAAARTESDIVWAVITANANMGDGTPLFHANHGNLKASGSGAPTVATVGAGRAAMRVQRGLGGSLINVEPRYLIVPAALETSAEQFLSNVNYVSVAGTFAPVPERMRSALTLIVEPRLDATSVAQWYLAADPAQIDTIEYAYLEGQETVKIEIRNGFDIDGMEVKAQLDFAAKAIDWRGLYKDNGV